jgi:hypothetical protein
MQRSPLCTHPPTTSSDQRPQSAVGLLVAPQNVSVVEIQPGRGQSESDESTVGHHQRERAWEKFLTKLDRKVLLWQQAIAGDELDTSDGRLRLPIQESADSGST